MRFLRRGLLCYACPGLEERAREIVEFCILGDLIEGSRSSFRQGCFRLSIFEVIKVPSGVLALRRVLLCFLIHAWRSVCDVGQCCVVGDSIEASRSCLLRR